MKYIGSKRRIAKEILPIMLKNRKEDQVFVDVFAGGFNLIQYVANPRIGNDCFSPITEFFKALQEGWEPPQAFSKEEYLHMKHNKELFPLHLLGFIGHTCAFGAKYFGSWATGRAGDYCAEGYRGAMKQKPLIEGVKIENKDYRDLKIPFNSIIYCDPPYSGTLKYRGEKFNHEEFWQWVREKTKEGHKVFVSEYSAPADFKCIWEREIPSQLNNIKPKLKPKAIEKLFVYSKSKDEI